MTRREHSTPRSLEAQLSSAALTAQQAVEVAELADRLYNHVLRVIDLGRLSQLEQCIWSELDQMNIDDELGELATALLAEALGRVGHAPERHVNPIPIGISEDEVLAAEYDDDCRMCRSEVADMEYRLSGQRCQDLASDAEDDDMCRFNEQAAQAWRAENAEALRRFGLAPNAASEAAP